MDLTHVLDRDVGVLSGGELQRFAIGIVAVQKVTRFSWKQCTNDVTWKYVMGFTRK